MVAEEPGIGCCRCSKVCPTDATSARPLQIHNVLREACTGCSSCVEKCPTEALAMKPVPVTVQHWVMPCRWRHEESDDDPRTQSAGCRGHGAMGNGSLRSHHGLQQSDQETHGQHWGVHPADHKRPAADQPVHAVPRRSACI